MDTDFLEELNQIYAIEIKQVTLEYEKWWRIELRGRDSVHAFFNRDRDKVIAKAYRELIEGKK